jgi:hypothetical protein
MGTDREIQALQTISDALSSLQESDPEAVARVLSWALKRFSTKDIVTHDHSDAVHAPVTPAVTASRAFDDISDLYHVADPTTDADRALVAGYWLQVIQAQKDFSGQDANKLLKDLGHGVTNITDALSKLIRRSPNHVMQTRKSGVTQQARKRYKLTTAGVAAIAERIEGSPS